MRAFVHDETYQKPSVPELEAMYEVREESGWQRYMAEPRLKAMCDEGGITSLAQLYTSPYKYDPDHFASKSLQNLDVLRQRGFLPGTLNLTETDEYTSAEVRL